MKRVAACAALAATMTIIVACGSDEKRLGADEFIKQANAVCDAGRIAIDAVAAEMFASGEQPTAEQLMTFGNETVVPKVQEQIDGIKKLSPPSDLEDDADQMIADAQEALDKIKDDPASALSGEEDPFADVNAQAAAIGLTACAGNEG